jgi:phasin
MSKVPYEIPAELRDFAGKSVEQARKAFETFIGAARQGVNSFDNPAFPAAAGAKEMGEKAVAFAENNVKAAFDLAEKLVKAKDIQEIMAHQSDYLKAQMAAVQEQAKAFGESVQKAVTPKK